MYQNEKVGGNSSCATPLHRQADKCKKTKIVAHLSSVCDSQAVQGPYGHMNNFLPSQSFNHLGFAYVNICAVTQSEVIPLTPVQINSSMLNSFTAKKQFLRLLRL